MRRCSLLRDGGKEGEASGRCPSGQRQGSQADQKGSLTSGRCPSGQAQGPKSQEKKGSLMSGRCPSGQAQGSPSIEKKDLLTSGRCPSGQRQESQESGRSVPQAKKRQDAPAKTLKAKQSEKKEVTEAGPPAGHVGNGRHKTQD